MYMKVSVCLTVYNEEKSIGNLLHFLLAQTKKAEEIVIVDGGSTDRTVEIIRHWQKKDKRIKLISEKGNVAHGRNTAVELAENNIIAMTDAGCIPETDWLEKITQPLKFKHVGMVAGFYSMPHSNPMQEAMNVYLGVPQERFDTNNFMPSTRSVAFRKEVWEEVGGFSEKLDKAGEDTLFFYQVVKTGTRIMRVKEALVSWEETAKMTFGDSINKFRQYAKGDAQSGIWWHPAKRGTTHNIKISAIFARYLLGLVLIISSLFKPTLFTIILVLITLYLFWSIWKWRDVIKNWQARLWLPVIQLSSDFAVMVGFIEGLASKGLVL